MKYSEEELRTLNETLKSKSPEEIAKWAVTISDKAIVTTNFRPYEAAILYVAKHANTDIPVVWCDTGYNTLNTYKHAEEVIELLDLNVDLYVPLQTAAHRDALMGIPDIDDPRHQLFTEQVKLEPFRRAMNKHNPDVWLTNLRKGQTTHRDNLDILSLGADGTLKVSPFFYWSDLELDQYLIENNLPNEKTYFDPTKVLENRECGLHV